MTFNAMLSSNVRPGYSFGRLVIHSTARTYINTLKPRQNGRHFADDTFKCIFLKENIRISTKISLKFVPKCPIDNIPALFQIKAWRRPGEKPLSEAMMVSLLTHICVVRPQWVNSNIVYINTSIYSDKPWTIWKTWDFYAFVIDLALRFNTLRAKQITIMMIMRMTQRW